MNLRITTRERIHPCCLCHKRLFTLCLLWKVKVKKKSRGKSCWLAAGIYLLLGEEMWLPVTAELSVVQSCCAGMFFPPHTIKRWMSRLWVSRNIWILFHDTCMASVWLWAGLFGFPSLLQGFELDHSGFDQVMLMNLISPKYRVSSANIQSVQCSGCIPCIRASRQCGILTDLAEYPAGYYIFKDIFVAFW